MPVELACGPKCSSYNHALELLAAVIRGNTQQIKAYCHQCYNFHTARDIWGRTVLHMAASCGKWEVVEWLLQETTADKAIKDTESGWTALHRAIFYGQLAAARILIMHHSPMQSRDNESLTALDLAMKDRLPHVQFSSKEPSDVYSWGDNANFNLGHGNEQRRNPELLELFHKGNISIKQVVMCKYHTVFLSDGGQAYTCGHGRGGRLGQGHEQTCLQPTLVEALKTEVVSLVAAARDHTLMLTESGIIYSCGLNDSHQLGQYPAPDKSLLPKQMNHKLLKGKVIEGICTGRFHTVIYTRDAVFTFGLNAGQLGHSKGDRICSQPRQVSPLNHKDFVISHVACSDAATVCATKKGDIYALHEYQCRKIASRWLDIVQVAVSGGQLDYSTAQEMLREKGGNELVVMVRTTSEKVFVWRSSSPTMKRCIWSPGRQLAVVDVTLTTSNIAIVTSDGEAFLGTFSQRAKKAVSAKDSKREISKDMQSSIPLLDDFSMLSLSDLIDKDDTEDVTLKRLPNIHRATQITADKKGRNFSVLQNLPNANLTELPDSDISDIGQHLQTLLDEADLGDLIHDAVLRIGSNEVPVHKFILASRSDYFRKIFLSEQENDVPPTVHIEDVDFELFMHLLKFIYTDDCDLLKIGNSFQLQTAHDQENVAVEDTNFNSGFIQVPNSKKKISAYEMREKKKGKDKEKGKKDPPVDGSGNNPVKQLHELAKRFGVHTLMKKLDAVKYVGGKIMSSGKYLSPPRPRFDRKKYPILRDVCIKADDSHTVQAHKCILVARLEYFHSMLASGWVETSNTEALTLPVPGDILSVIIDYLYTDESAIISDTDNAELLCNILVVADQLLITRLRQMCEVALAQLISLKNAAELLEFASVYNASQLKLTCQQFITLNIAAILEARSLDVVSESTMEELTKYYRRTVPSMCYRVITPYTTGPSSEELEALEEEGSLDGLQLQKEENSAKKNKTKRKRTRTKSSGEESQKNDRRETRLSICSDASLDDSFIQEEPSKEESITKPKAVSSQPMDIPFQRAPRAVWGPQSPPAWGSKGSVENVAVFQSPPRKESQEMHPDAASSPPQFISPGGATSQVEVFNMRQILAMELQSQQVQPMGVVKAVGQTKQTPKKLSQKERKRQMQHQKSSESEGQDNLSSSVTKEKPQLTNPWNSVSTAVPSFRDLMQADVRGTPSKSTDSGVDANVGKGAKPKVLTDRGGGDISFSWGLTGSSTSRGTSNKHPSQSPTSPTSPSSSPWQKKQPGEPSVQEEDRPLHKTVSFSQILKDEIQQRETLHKNTKKPLALIQMEEQAIQELLAHYRALENSDEHITIERVSDTAAAPIWAAHQKNTLP
ncbi:inhibitor of Bruton tyrosine kinase-like [Lingula anatina]|uniref:Inhibitor of Bruton tyrosine kinase-like n=1 Tax=Lingula anatina TaxID=7574 RepID=A0A1S3H675_LINAN|nr:inhibitor of Bruton tyrosine kinase-like [Lingula anatina]|eukprot:XP_013381620.1 inhibitor of Bruton tyrosine kinase-like [Lingula anatina]